MRNLRRFFFPFFLILLVGIALFPHEIVLACVKYQTAKYCKKAFDAEFCYDSFSWEKGKIVCKNGSLFKPGHLQATFSEASLHPAFGWKKREVGGKLHVCDLRIVNKKIAPQNLPSPPSPSLPFFTLNLKTTIEGGEVFLYDFLETSPFFQYLHFDVEHHVVGRQTFGSVAFEWEEEPPLITYFSRTDETVLRLETDFHHHSFPALYDLMAYFFHSRMPEPVTHWHIRKGKIDGNLGLSILNGDPFHLQGKISLSELHAENAPLELIGEIDRFTADLDVDFTSVTAMNGEFFLQGGRLALEERREFWQGIWDLSNLHTKTCVKEGKLESSVLRGNFMGMGGELLLDWHSPDVLMRMGFQGYSKEMSALLPIDFQESFREAFDEDHFSLEARLSRSGEGLELEGTLSIKDEEAHQLEFGCLFGHGKEEIDLVVEMLPYSLSRSVDSFLDHLAHQFCLSHKRFGWFHAEQFPIEKFLSPFLLKDVRMEASGRADFQGTFDERYLVISYEGCNFQVESPHFSLTAVSTKKESSQDVVAVHYIDLKTWDHVGFLPLTEARYYQKNRDLLFTEAQAVVHFENHNIHIQEIEACWDQLLFKGELEIEARARDDVDLKIQAHYVKGPAADAQQLLSHFSHSIFWELPFEGKVVSEGDVFSFHYHFTPLAKLLSGNLQGDFIGCFEKPHLKCSGHVTYNLKEIGLDFESTCCAFSGTIGKSIVLEGEGVSLKAQQYAGGLHVNAFSYDSWQGEGDLKWSENEIYMQNFSIREPQGECIFSGIYNRNQKVLKGRIDSFNWNFAETLSLWKPQGEIFGSGTFEWKLADGVEAYMATSFKGLEFGGIHFGDGEDLSCYYSSKYGISAHGLEVEIPTEKGIEKYKLGRFSYDFKHPKILFEGFDFSLPPEKLPWVAELAGNLFPGKVHPTIVDWVEALKQNEPLEGRISLEIYPDNIWVYLSLKDGSYYLSDKQFNIKNFLLLYDPLEFNIWTKVFYRDDYYWVHLLTDSMTMSHGQLEISERELSPCSPAGYNALVTKWERHREKGWCVHNVQGNFHGVHMALGATSSMDFSDRIHLEGRIGLDAKQIYPLLGDELTHIFDFLSLSGGYAMEGRFTIPKSDFSKFTFAGTLTGSDFSLARVEIDSFSSKLNYQPNYIGFSDLTIKDWAGRLTCGQVDFIREQQGWQLYCDALKLQDVRISRLKCPWTKWSARKKPFYRSFFIRNFELNHLQGDLADLATLGGEGILDFTNLPKRTLFSNLLLLPTEITARIGLDLTALIPVRGIVDYEIRDQKVYFNEFREMYSDGKRSRFYLAEGTTAYVDFAGNLNMKLKMKQYNLLMKLAEFFTISVKGTFFNPTYTLSNQFEDD